MEKKHAVTYSKSFFSQSQQGRYKYQNQISELGCQHDMIEPRPVCTKTLKDVAPQKQMLPEGTLQQPFSIFCSIFDTGW